MDAPSRAIGINPPLFGAIGQDEKVPRNGIISLVDIFDDFLFSGERSNTVNRSVKNNNEVLNEEDDYDDDDDSESNDESADGKPRKKSRTSTRNMTEEQKLERR